VGEIDSNEMMDAARPYAALHPGDPAPWFHQRASNNPRFALDTAAGRYIVLCFFASAGDAAARAALDAVAQHRTLFDDEQACFFGVTVDATDEASGRLKESLPGIRFFWDFDGAVGRLYGAAPSDTQPNERQVAMRRFWMVLDPTLRVMRTFPFTVDGREHAAVFAYLKSLPPPGRGLGFAVPPPVLFVPDVFEPALCRRLVELYGRTGGCESGFMREVDGKTVMQLDPSQKKRHDLYLEDPELIAALQARIERRIVPELLRVHHFKATRLERNLVACYSAEDGGHFRPHRDNTTKGTAHRRFAVSINLNADFDGGTLGFPEYGRQAFKMPPGCAAVFSCSLLHMVSPMTRGRRYAFLPFLYDDEAARLRLANNAFLGDDVPAYSDPEIELGSSTHR
jgi:predicted 2-oxoglutarate/Fe(II)-dependent dioxygenase YbiX/peroxiredoxin